MSLEEELLAEVKKAEALVAEEAEEAHDAVVMEDVANDTEVDVVPPIEPVEPVVPDVTPDVENEGGRKVGEEFIPSATTESWANRLTSGRRPRMTTPLHRV